MNSIERRKVGEDNLGRPIYRNYHKSVAGPDPHARSRDEALRRHEQTKAALRMHTIVEDAIHPTAGAREITDHGRAMMAAKAVREGWTPSRMDNELAQDRNPDRKYRRPLRVRESLNHVVEGYKALGTEGTREKRPILHDQMRTFHGEFATLTNNPQFPKLAAEGARIMHEVEAERHDGRARLRPGERALLSENTVAGYVRPMNVAVVAAERLGLSPSDVSPRARRLEPEAAAKARLRGQIRAAMHGS